MGAVFVSKAESALTSFMTHLPGWSLILFVTGNEVHFKVKPHTTFSKLFDAYKKSQAVTDVRFMFDGSRVQPTQTPQELGMEDEDCIDAFIEQVSCR